MDEAIARWDGAMYRLFPQAQKVIPPHLMIGPEER